MRRPCADREEKRVTYGNGLRHKEEEQLDANNPNQRGLLGKVLHPIRFLEQPCICASACKRRPSFDVILDESRSVAALRRLGAVLGLGTRRWLSPLVPPGPPTTTSKWTCQRR